MDLSWAASAEAVRAVAKLRRFIRTKYHVRSARGLACFSPGVTFRPALSAQRRSCERRTPVARRLFVCVGELEQRGLRPRTAVDGHPGRKLVPAREAHRDIDRGEAGRGREKLAVIPVRCVQVA